MLPVNLTVGTASGLGATLRVRGDQLPVLSQWSPPFPNLMYSTFRTDIGTGNNQSWSMVRGALEIGRIWNVNPATALNLQAMQADANLWLRNSDADGIRVNFNGAGAILNSYTLDRQGFAAVGNANAMNFSLTPNAPWSRWHLVHTNQGANQPYFGFRPWMRNGITGTGNSDLFYLGHKYAMTGGTGAEVDDNSDVVAAWGDDVLPAGTNQAFNNFSFRYVGNLNVGGTAGSIEGLEMMRLRPYRTLATDPIQGFVGIGDWANAGAALPDQRLDMLDGKLRIRQLPNDAEMTAATKAMVVDATGVVGWRTFPVGGGGTDCRWALNSPNKLITATSYNGLCVDQTKFVGIGTNAPQSKLQVTHTTFAPTGSNIALSAYMDGVAGTGPVATYDGVFGGVSGSSTGELSALHGIATATTATSGQVAGAYAEVTVFGDATANYA